MTVSLDVKKFRKCHALMIAGATEGERQAARTQAQKIAAKAELSLVEALEVILSQIPEPILAHRAVTVTGDLFLEVPKQPFIWRPGEGCLILYAGAVFGLAEKTIRKLVKRNGIFVKTPDSTKMLTCLAAVSMVVHGDFTALELLRNDNRDDPRVARHIQHADEREQAYLALERLKAKRPV